MSCVSLSEQRPVIFANRTKSKQKGEVETFVSVHHYELSVWIYEARSKLNYFRQLQNLNQLYCFIYSTKVAV
jgi:hypothetical protein